MTPQERQLVTDLFDRLASLEENKRDPQAEALISEGLRRAPHAVYALVQTTLIQDEALRNADARIQELEGGGPGASTQGGFLDNMRDVFMGRSSEGRPSVPSVGGSGGAPWQSQRGPQMQQGAPVSGGGSFLGTAAASAAGVIGGALLLNSFRSMFGGGSQQGALDSQSAQASPWSGGDAANSDLAKDAGVGDIGRGGRDTSNDRASLADTSNSGTDSDSDSDDHDDGGDFGFDDSDVA
jgi:hypothetical protein